MLHYDTQTQHCLSNISPNTTTNTWKHTHKHTQFTPVVVLSGKAHSLGSLAPVLSGFHSKWPPHDHAHYGSGRQPLSGLRLPGCKQWFMAQGSVKEQPRLTPQPFMGTRTAEAVWQWGWIKSLATRLNPVLRPCGPRQADGERYCFFCVCVWKDCQWKRHKDIHG